MVNWYVKTDYLRCNPKFCGNPQYNFVIMNLPWGHVFAQLVFVFVCQVNGRDYHLALAQLLEKQSWATTRVIDRSLSIHRWHIQAQNRCEVIPLDSIICGAVLVADTRYAWDYFVIDMLDEDMFLWVNVMSWVKCYVVFWLIDCAWLIIHHTLFIPSMPYYVPYIAYLYILYLPCLHTQCGIYLYMQNNMCCASCSHISNIVGDHWSIISLHSNLSQHISRMTTRGWDPMDAVFPSSINSGSDSEIVSNCNAAPVCTLILFSSNLIWLYIAVAAQANLCKQDLEIGEYSLSDRLYNYQHRPRTHPSCKLSFILL